MESVINYGDVNPSDKMEEDKSIFIWLGILGFADAVENEERYGELSELLIKFQSKFNNEHSYSTNIISDGIILQIAKPRHETFIEIINDIGKKQFQFICETNEFIRGGIALGTKLEDDKGRNNHFISNGLARAVRLESSCVNWPIIGTNEKNMSDIREFFNIYDEGEKFGLIRGFNKKGDDIFFINFISHSLEYFDLLNSKIEIFSKKEKSKYNPRVRDKYIWLLRYYLHNYKDNEITSSLQGAVL